MTLVSCLDTGSVSSGRVRRSRHGTVQSGLRGALVVVESAGVTFVVCLNIVVRTFSR